MSAPRPPPTHHSQSAHTQIQNNYKCKTNTCTNAFTNMQTHIHARVRTHIHTCSAELNSRYLPCSHVHLAWGQEWHELAHLLLGQLHLQHHSNSHHGDHWSHDIHKFTHTSSGTALMFVKPLRKTTNTFLAPQRRAEVAQSKAVSPAPSTTTVPDSCGRDALHAHMPAAM